MLAAWNNGTGENLFLLCRSTAFKLTFEESIIQTPLSWIMLVSKSLYNRADIIRRFHPFSLEPTSSASFLDKFQT